MIREVIFDIDGTLYDYDSGHEIGMKAMEEYAEKELGISKEEFRGAYKRLNQKITARLGKSSATIHSRSIRLQNILEEYGKPLFPHIRNLYRLYWDGLLDNSQPEPGSLACMKELRDLGLTIGIGTDMTAMIQYEKLEVFGFGPYINHIVTSQEAGEEKPSKAIMELCVEKSGFKPQECLFVGDNFKKDVKGALDVGMNAVWYNPKGAPLPEQGEALKGAYHEIRHYDELVPYLKELNS